MEKNTRTPHDKPDWLTEDGKIIEPVFCEEFLYKHPMKCVHGSFFTIDGLVSDEALLKQAIYDDISPWMEVRIARKVDGLLSAMRLVAFHEEIPLHYDRIHVANGTWYLDGGFSRTKEYCRNRLNVSYNPAAKYPDKWNPPFVEVGDIGAMLYQQLYIWTRKHLICTFALYL